ncbi:hypothetical protein [Brevibacillus dissolubilis]|uniref:hypothetical protein n=1 Tax=Brevibacillus dissolubilis TaxID=1844116 RepID=UPI0011164E69|nr:hypothetical protein [Brevibacillus dissolubilis]
MKFPTICHKCLVEQGTASFIDLDFQDDGIYTSVCEKGHESLVCLQEELFQILFEHGAMALLDGYQREAVSSFASSLERFYEFSIKVLLLHRGVPMEEIQNTWKLVAAQSERQLGAFYFLFASQFGFAPNPVAQQWVKFRNDVIHKGHIPSRDKVLGYAEHLYNYMVSLLKVLKEDFQESFLTAITHKQKNPQLIEAQKEGNITFVGLSPMLDMMSASFGTKTFGEALEALRVNKDVLYPK